MTNKSGILRLWLRLTAKTLNDEQGQILRLRLTAKPLNDGREHLLLIRKPFLLTA
ncbi:hypothetical protein H5T87_07685 [bacterium]|nr:hypothetical protein [bacterium]